jgi:orotidine-5'-phosphate decarboxylase
LRRGVEPHDLEGVSAVTIRFCKAVIDAVCDCAPIVKPQAAFFEQLGPAGMQALHQVIIYARQQGLLVLLDGKRGDIGSTAEGYADAYLGSQSPWQCDSLTINPYLGNDTLQPFLQTAMQRRAGVFVLVKTSNSGSGFLQDLKIDGVSVYQRVAQVVQAAALVSAEGSTSGYGHAGAVVGATYPHQLAEMRQAMPNAWILIPGFGAQGATAEDVRAGFDSRGLGAIVNSSRGIIFASELPEFKHLDWQEAIAASARAMANQLSQCRGN